jgi:hypothetical protein
MTAPPPPQAPHGTASQYEQAQRDEWSRFVALVPIDFYGTRAYNPGDPVPVSAVEGDAAWIDTSWVSAREGSHVASATMPPPEPPTIDPSSVGAPPGAATVDPTTIVESEG